MMTHPLTDEICEELSVYPLKEFNCDDGIITDMRTAADWQLERVIEWLNNNFGHSNYLEPLWPYGHKIDVDGVLCDLKEAMRPQQQEDN